MIPKHCEFCGKQVVGRSDKRFCDHYCRSAYHNAQNRTRNLHTKPITRVLQRNRTIMHNQLRKGRTRVTKLELTLAGFDFRMHTHIKRDEDQNPTIFCFDLGYLPQENNYFALVNDPAYASGQ